MFGMKNRKPLYWKKKERNFKCYNGTSRQGTYIPIPFVINGKMEKICFIGIKLCEMGLKSVYVSDTFFFPL